MPTDGIVRRPAFISGSEEHFDRVSNIVLDKVAEGKVPDDEALRLMAVDIDDALDACGLSPTHRSAIGRMLMDSAPRREPWRIGHRSVCQRCWKFWTDFGTGTVGDECLCPEPQRARR